MTELLKVSGLTKRFGSHSAVSSVDLNVGVGKIVALLGANGAGKSTTIKIVSGLDAPDDGQIECEGEDVSDDARARRALVSYLPEQVALYEELSGRDNLKHLLQIATRKTWRAADLDPHLRSAGLAPEAWDKPAGSYSKGMRQKVGLALALARGAKLLLLDEPTSGLDPLAAAELGKALKRFTESGGGVLMATHDVYRAAEIANTVLIMKQGKIISSLDPTNIAPKAIEERFFDEMGTRPSSAEPAP